MTLDQIYTALSKLEKPSNEMDVEIWLHFGENLGKEQSVEGRLKKGDRTNYHLKPSCFWNGRDLSKALQWCRENNPEEIDRIAFDWGVPLFTKSLDAAKIIIPTDSSLCNMSQPDRLYRARAELRYEGNVAYAEKLECAILMLGIKLKTMGRRY